jgi:hypothetical protein
MPYREALLGCRRRWGSLNPSKSLQRIEMSGLDLRLIGDARRRAPCRNHHIKTARLSTSRRVVPVYFLARLGVRDAPDHRDE